MKNNYYPEQLCHSPRLNENHCSVNEIHYDSNPPPPLQPLFSDESTRIQTFSQTNHCINTHVLPKLIFQKKMRH